MTIQVTDEMVEAVWRHNQGTALLTKQMPFAQIDEVWRRHIREVLEAALSVAPAPVAGDVEMDEAIDDLLADARSYERVPLDAPPDVFYPKHDAYHAARAHVLALHAQAGDAKLRELREWVAKQESYWPSDDQWGKGFGSGVRGFRDQCVKQIDAMLKGATDGTK